VLCLSLIASDFTFSYLVRPCLALFCIGLSLLPGPSLASLISGSPARNTLSSRTDTLGCSHDSRPGINTLGLPNFVVMGLPATNTFRSGNTLNGFPNDNDVTLVFDPGYSTGGSMLSWGTFWRIAGVTFIEWPRKWLSFFSLQDRNTQRAQKTTIHRMRRK